MGSTITMNVSIDQIFKIGSIVVVLAGIVGAFWGGSKRQKTASDTDAGMTIDIKDKAIAALRGEVSELRAIVEKQGVEIKQLQETNAAYIKLFQGNPSRLEGYMKETRDSMLTVERSLELILKLHQLSPSSVTVNTAPAQTNP
jgi:SMC interacting uncharacterized protein involved in chromosome segregation